MDKYQIETNLGLDTLAERITVRGKDKNKLRLLTKMELMDMATSAVAFQEYQPLLKLSPANVASYIDIFTSVDHQISAAFINLVSEYFPMGNLDQYLGKLRQERQPLDDQLIDKWFAQVLDGLMYLWDENITHRNLKADSIYLRGENNEASCALIIGDMIPDSVAFDLRMRTRLPRRALSYTAPEIFRSEPYTASSDIYSFGCILLDMITCDTLTDEETLQLRICARHDLSTLSETLHRLQTTHETIARLIGHMMIPDLHKRLKVEDLKAHDYVIESMHAIDSDRMKYPAKRDVNWTRNDLAQNGKLEIYLNYLKQHRNAESRVEYALHSCNQSKSIDLSNLALRFEKEIIPVVEHYPSNVGINQNTLDLLARVVHNDTLLTSKVVIFLTKMIPVCHHDQLLMVKLIDLLIDLTARNPKLLINARKTADLVEVMNKYDDHAEISGKCCTLLWLMAKNSITNDLRGNLVSILRSLLNLLQKHPHDSDLFTKVCMAFLPLIFQKPLLDQLAQFNLVRFFTMGLQQHLADRQAIKAGSLRSLCSSPSKVRSRLALTVLTELFRLDERCVMRFLCSRSTDGTLLDTMDILNRIFNRYPNSNDVARALMLLLTSMLPYDDAVDEMISTRTEQNLLYQIKRFHSDDQETVRMSDGVMRRLRERN